MALMLTSLAQSAATDFNHYAALGVLLLIAIGFGVVSVVATMIIGPNRDGSVKASVYESGMNPWGTARRRFNVRFYMVAMTFLLFDVEIAFLYPWAVTYPSLAADDPMRGVFLWRLLFFLVTSIIAFAYAWRKGVFKYD